MWNKFLSLLVLLSTSQAYSWSVKALQSLVANFPKPPLIDVLRQSAKACVLKREFKKARLLIKQVCRNFASKLWITYKLLYASQASQRENAVWLLEA